MKGLLKKEWYTIVKDYRLYLLLVLVFEGVSFFGGNMNFFFVFYPALLFSMVPLNLLSADEQSGWLKYSLCLPCSRAAVVSVKYLLGILLGVSASVFIFLIQLVRMVIQDLPLDWDLLLIALLGLPVVSWMPMMICLPIAFKKGTQKSRVIFTAALILVGCFVGLCTSLGIFSTAGDTLALPGTPALRLGAYGLFLLVGLGLLTLSWRLAVRAFEKRDL